MTNKELLGLPIGTKFYTYNELSYEPYDAVKVGQEYVRGVHSVFFVCGLGNEYKLTFKDSKLKSFSKCFINKKDRDDYLGDLISGDAVFKHLHFVCVFM